jgi:radical SAM superfamily enzyme YgiQ (UPF0313 family)
MVNPNIYDMEMLSRLRKIGLHFTEVGVQSLDPKIRNKIFNRPESNQQILNFLGALKRLGVYTQVDHIINPWDTNENLRKQLYLYNKIRPSWINVFYLLYYPGTKITELALQEGFLSKEQKQRISMGEFTRTYFIGGNVPEKTITEVRDIAMLLTFLPILPKTLVNTILNKHWEKAFSWIPHKTILVARAINAMVRKDDFWGRSNLKSFLRDFWK